MEFSNPKSVRYDSGAKQISFIDAGPSDGPLLILLHGWPGVAETWKYQIEHFMNLGFRVIAPDMPGYGKSTANNNIEDYAHVNMIRGLLALLESTGKTSCVWIGHDWGAAVASSLVATHPEVVDGMAWLAVPYKTLELGYQEMLPFVNRTIYPQAHYPYGQWDYQKYYEEHFDRATSVFNSGIGYAIKVIYVRSTPSVIGTRSPLSEIRAKGGRFGKVDKLPSADTVPLSGTLLDDQLYEILLQKFSLTGFGPSLSYYMNHARNKAFSLENQKNEGYLKMPCLFVEAKFDTALDTFTSSLLQPMREHCENFSFASVEAGHWLALERPVETNKAIEDWLRHKMAHQWPAKQVQK